MWNDLKNKMICILVRNTHLYSSVLYAIAWKAQSENLEFCIKEVKKCKAESGCSNEKEYSKWFQKTLDKS